MNTGEHLYEKNLIIKLKQGDTVAFSFIFSAYYANLLKFVYPFTKDQVVAEEIVQDIFVQLWESRQTLNIQTSLRSYLLKTAQNKSLDWLRHLKVREKHTVDVLENAILLENDTENYIFQSELELIIEKAITDMPDDLSESFRMNRFEGLKYKEIADKLNVSVRTIEVRMSKALVMLREKLKDYLVIIAFLLNFFGER